MRKKRCWQDEYQRGPVSYERMKLKRQQCRAEREQEIIRRAVAMGYCK